MTYSLEVDQYHRPGVLYLLTVFMTGDITSVFPGGGIGFIARGFVIVQVCALWSMPVSKHLFFMTKCFWRLLRPLHWTSLRTILKSVHNGSVSADFNTQSVQSVVGHDPHK